MSGTRFGSLALLAAAAVFAAGDARRGEALFQSHKCVTCHSVHGQGGSGAPDLGRGFARGYTPAVMASLMWNHAPAMWSAMRTQGIPVPRVSEEEAADLFAYFFSARYFERPGDAGRGKRVFVERHCGDCHGIGVTPGKGRPVASWQSLADPIILVQQMWNHASEMQQAMAGQKIAWVQLTAQELTDLLVFLQNLPQTKSLVRTATLPSSDRGATLFEARGCQRCHQGKLALEKRLANRTLVDIAVAMWNHAPRMLQAPLSIEAGEMRQIIGYAWSTQFFESGGDAAHGKRLFATRHCAECHPSVKVLKRGPGSHSAISVVAALWRHGPAMQEKMKEKNIAWPRFRSSDMADLIAHLNTK